MAEARPRSAAPWGIETGALWANALRGAVYLALYVLLDWGSYFFAYSVAGMTPWNPQAGLSLALLLRYGLGFWPFVALGTVVAEIVVRGQDAWPVLATLAAIAALAYAAAAALLTRGLGVAFRAPTVRGAIAFMLVATGAAAAVGFFQAELFAAVGDIARGQIPLAALRAATGELSGIFVLTPLLMRLAEQGWHETRRRLAGLRWETALQAIALALALWLVFGLESTDEFKFFYLLLLPVGWVALRHGFDGACAAALGAQLGTFLLSLHRGFEAETATEFQILSVALMATALVAGAIADERTRAALALAEHRIRLAHAARISAAGEMTSALAHELSQPLAAMATYIAACRRAARDGAPRAELIESIDAAAAQAERARQVIARLRGFLRRGEVTLAEVSAQSVLTEAVALIRPEAELNRIEIALAFDPAPIRIRADTVQLQQVVLNLVRNAVEAIVGAGASARRIEIALGRDGGEAEIAVADTGPGIAPEVAATLFEPFASGKPKGMGLGLAIGRSLIEAHGGRLTLAPARPGEGARFVIRLPLAGPHG
jgi:signal transduction histidine kinase